MGHTPASFPHFLLTHTPGLFPNSYFLINHLQNAAASATCALARCLHMQQFNAALL